MSKVSFESIQQVGQEVLAFAPKYDIFEHDPFAVLERNIGNCAAKAAVAAGIIEVRYDVEPAVAFNGQKHGKSEIEYTPMGPKHREAHIAHIDALTDTNEGIAGLAFGMKVIEVDGEKHDGMCRVELFNQYLEYAEIDDSGKIGPTKEAQEQAYTVLNWRDGIGEYLEALKQPLPDFDKLTDEIEKHFVN